MRCCDTFGLTPWQYAWACARCVPSLVIMSAVALVTLTVVSVGVMVCAPASLYFALVDTRARDRRLTS